MLCNAVRCIKNLNQEQRDDAVEQNDPAPWSIERTCHYLKRGLCPRTKRFWDNQRNPVKSSGQS